MPTRRSILLTCFAMTVVTASPMSAQPASSDALAKAVQGHYQQVKDFTASFEQAYVGDEQLLLG